MKSEIIIQLHRNFEKVIDKAKQSCYTAGHSVADHFPDVRKMFDIGSGAEREIDDIALTRYAEMNFIGKTYGKARQHRGLAP